MPSNVLILAGVESECGWPVTVRVDEIGKTYQPSSCWSEEIDILE